MTEHAPVAPSSLSRTIVCNGWIQQAQNLPELPETEEEKEGTAAHSVALWAALHPDRVASLQGTSAPNGVPVTDEMIDGAMYYIEALEGHPGIGEQRIPIVRIHEVACWGTPDFFQWNPATRILRIVDYKFGHLFIEVFENWQLIAYAAGVMDFLRLSDTDVILELVVVQPRAYHPEGPIRTWNVSATKLRAMINQAYTAAHAALGPNPSTVSGPHCLHCPARHACPTFDKTVGNILDFVGVAYPVRKTPGDIGRELRLVQDARQRLKARETGLEAQAEALLREGKAVPFFAMEQSVGRLDWFDDVSVSEVEALAQMNGKSALKPPALITPTQAIKRKIIDAAVISAYADRSRGAMKLVRDSLTKATKVFSK